MRIVSNYTYIYVQKWEWRKVGGGWREEFEQQVKVDDVRMSNESRQGGKQNCRCTNLQALEFRAGKRDKLSQVAAVGGSGMK
eukprot:750448-Hanusia_phi.AAC.11